MNDAGAGALEDKAPRHSFNGGLTLDERRGQLVVLGLILLAFALRVAGLEFQSLWRDEVDAIRFASRPILDLLGMFTSPAENGPLFFLLLRPWLRLAGQSEFALRYFSVLLGVLTVPLIYRLARRLFPSLSGVALIAALLAVTSPYLVWYSQEGKMYALVVALILFSMERYLAALEKGGLSRWLVYVAATALALYVHVVAVLIIPVQVVVFFLQERRDREARWRPWLASLAALTLPYLPLLAWQLPLVLKPAQTGFRSVALPEMLLSLWGSYSFGVAQDASPWIGAAFVAALFAAGLLRPADRPRRVSLGVLVCWLFLPVILLFLVTLVRPLYTARYLIFILPAYLILLAVGVVAIGRRTLLLAGALLFVLLAVNGWGLWLQSRTEIKADFRSATEYVVRKAGPDDLILFQIPYGRYSFDYYVQQMAVRQTVGQQPGWDLALGDDAGYRAYIPLLARGGGLAYQWAEGLYTNLGMSATEADRRMVEMTGGSSVVWLLASESAMWDERALVEDWLDGHGNLTDAVHYVRVSVYRYELPEHR